MIKPLYLYPRWRGFFYASLILTVFLMADPIFSPDALSQAASQIQPDPQAQPAPSQGESKWPYAALVAGQGADIFSTMAALHNPHLQEGNGMGLAGTMGAKAGVSALAALLMHRMANTGHPTAAKAIGVLGGAAGAVPALLNMRTMANNK